MVQTPDPVARPRESRGMGQDQGSPGSGKEGSCRGLGAQAGRRGTLALGMNGERQEGPPAKASHRLEHQFQAAATLGTSTPHLGERVLTPVVETCLLS